MTVTVKNGQFGGYEADGVTAKPVVDFTALEEALDNAGVLPTGYTNIGKVYLPKGDTKIPVDITALFTALKNVETALGKASDTICRIRSSVRQRHSLRTLTVIFSLL